MVSNAEVVLFSGLDETEPAALAGSCGADGWLQRTGDPIAFAAAVRRFPPK